MPTFGVHRIWVIAAAVFVVVSCCHSLDVNAAEQVRGHTNKNGKYVAPHLRSKANKNEKDNFSSKGRGNPYTGKRGKKSSKFPS